MEDLKAERSDKKRKITIIANRIERALERQLPMISVSPIVIDLENHYSDFQDINNDYNSALDQDHTLKDKYEIVNNLDPASYTDEVNKLYQRIKQSFDQYGIDKIMEEVQELCEQLDARINKVGEEQSIVKLELALERIQMITKDISDFKRRKQEHPKGTWMDVSLLIDAAVKRSEETQDEIRVLQSQGEREASLPFSSSSGGSEGLTQLSASTIQATNASVAHSSPQSPSILATSVSPLPSQFEQLRLRDVVTPVQVSPFTVFPQSSSQQFVSSLPASQFNSQGTTYSPSIPYNITASTSLFRPLSYNAVPLSSAFSSSQQNPTPQVASSFSTIYGSTQAAGNPMVVSSSVPTTPSVLTTGIAPQPAFHYRPPDIKVKRVDLPTFSGDRKDWPEFKTMWPRLAVPAFQNKETLAAELRRCLTGTAAKEKVRSVSIVGPEAIDIMWKKLTDYYDDPAASVDAALNRLYKLRPVKEEDYKSLISLVDEVEISYSQLVTWDQKSCLTQRDVDSISNLLPLSIKTEWHRIYHQLGPADKLHPFPVFMRFLEQEKNMFARLAEQQISSHSVRRGASHAGFQEREKKKEGGAPHAGFQKKEGGASHAGFQRKEGNSKFKQCAVHQLDTVKHSTATCSVFLSLSQSDKLSALKSIGACFRCFKNHRRSSCKERDPCKTCGNPNHHTLLCRTDKEQQIEKPIIAVTTSGHTSRLKNVSLYATYSVPVYGNRKCATLFADDGSDTSYITASAAKRLGARKLGDYILLITTTGGVESEYESHEYELDFVTKSGKVVTISMFSMPKITRELTKFDPAVISKLFPNHDCSELQRHSTVVDVLIGTDYFGFHPKKEISSAGDHLSLMEGVFGRCIQGTHPLLQRDYHGDSNMVFKSACVMRIATNSNRCSSVQHPIFTKPISPTSAPACKHLTRITQSERSNSTSDPVYKSLTHLNQSESSKIQSYIEGEELTTQIVPKCGSCKCTKCPLKGHTYSFQEEVELRIIQNNLRYDPERQCWFTSYPWKMEPASLPNNHPAVYSSLRKLEVKLKKDENLAETYQRQIVDMVDREVAREVPKEELNTHMGPNYYISHLGAPNPKSKSTPYRIVFNSSQQYKGVSLNDALYKGPDAYLNNQLGILLRWREEEVAIVGDIKKMYNSVHLEPLEQHMHRFLWTNLQYGSSPKTFIMTRVNMGDKPAGAISTEALYKTAEMFSSNYPPAARLLKVGSYVDDLMDSVRTLEEAHELTKETEVMLGKGGFFIKFWLYSGEVTKEGEEAYVLGVLWIPVSDDIAYKLSLNFSPKRQGVHILPDLTREHVPAHIPAVLTKRIVLSQVMRVYDPMGLLSPFTITGKVLLRASWELKLGWDDPLPPKLHSQWIRYFLAIYDANDLKYPRVLKPTNSSGNPVLLLFSDASDLAYGFAAYIRWLCTDGKFWSRLVMAKSRIAPMVKRSTPQLELNAAVMSKRAREVLTQEMRYNFDKILHLIDSETVLAMLHKTSTRFRLYEGVRVGEIQTATNGDVSCWAWVTGTCNPADWLTRGKEPKELGLYSEWISGPKFLSLPMEEWELKFQPTSEITLPGEKHAVTSHATEGHIHLMKYENFSNYERMLRILGRICNVFKKKSLLALKEGLTPDLLQKAEILVIKDVQQIIQSECLKCDKRGRTGGKFVRLNPSILHGVWVVGRRLVFNPMALENKSQSLMPTKHPVTTLLMKQAHRSTMHGGRDVTLARFRHKYWTPQASKVAEAVAKGCQLCKLRRPKLMSQKMGYLPEERSKPAPPFSYVMIDYFGPYSVRGEIQKRTTGKVWGIVFADLVSRAVFLEAVYEYSTDSFLQALTKFASVRGYPRIIYSDPGSQLVAASKELQDQWNYMWKQDGERISTISAEKGLEWRFSSPDSPWQNGAVEVLVKSSKKAIHYAMNERRLSASEFSCLLYDVANTLNDRPLGTLLDDDSELSIITPNTLLLGRSTAKNPSGWEPDSSLLKRYHLVQQVSQCFWKQWTKTVAPGLITREKWHAEKKNLEVGDVVLILSDSAIKAEYRLGKITEVFPDGDGVVRKVAVMYKHCHPDVRVAGYSGSREQVVIRPVQRLALLVPVNTAGDDALPI